MYVVKEYCYRVSQIDVKASTTTHSRAEVPVQPPALQIPAYPHHQRQKRHIQPSEESLRKWNQQCSFPTESYKFLQMLFKQYNRTQQLSSSEPKQAHDLLNVGDSETFENCITKIDRTSALVTTFSAERRMVSKSSRPGTRMLQNMQHIR